MNFQSRLRELRLEKKLTQQDIANKLGITRQAYGYYESPDSKREPDHATTIKLASIFDVSIDYLLTGKDYTDKAKEILEDQNLQHAAIDGDISEAEALERIARILEKQKGRTPGQKQKKP